MAHSEFVWVSDQNQLTVKMIVKQNLVWPVTDNRTFVIGTPNQCGKDNDQTNQLLMQSNNNCLLMQSNSDWPNGLLMQSNNNWPNWLLMQNKTRPS
jgi:hypothetical protein